MKIKIIFKLFVLVVCAVQITFSQPASWASRGVGGGGAVYSPSISPHDGNEFFLSCDMTPVHHTTDFGQTWSLIHYAELHGQRNTEVQFTASQLKLFALKRNNAIYLPAKSYDGGVTWISDPTNPCINSAWQFHASPFDTDLVVISDANRIFFNNSENNPGDPIIFNYPGMYGVHLAGVYFENKDTLYVCAHDSLIYTFNGGASWASAPGGTNGIPSNEHIVSFKGAKQGNKWVFYCVTIQANSLNRIYQTWSDDYIYYKGIYKLSQGQNQWNSIGGNLPNLNNSTDKVYLLGMSRKDTSVVYVAGNSTSVQFNSSNVPLGTIFRSTDGGNSFSNVFITSGIFNANSNITTGWIGKASNASYKFNWYGTTSIDGIAVDPNNSSRIISADGMMVHTSTDKGANWQQAYTDVTYDNAPSTLVQHSSLYKTSGLETTASYWVTWTNPATVFASYNDILARRSTDGGHVWSFDIYGLDSSKINDINMTIFNPSTGLMYAAAGEVPGSNGDYTDYRVSLVPGRISVSADNGITWATLKSFGQAVTSIALDPNSANGMYATVVDVPSGIGGVHYCADIINNPAAWNKLPSHPRTEGRALKIIPFNNGDLVSVYGPRDVSTNQNPSYVYSAGSGVFYSSDGGQTWADRTPAAMTIATINVEIDPNDASQSTWIGFVSQITTTPGVYRTSDKGLTWTQVYNQSGYSCTFHPLLQNEMYICTERNGLLYATNTNTNSFSINSVTSYPFRNPQKVFFNPYDVNEVWITSNGNGNKVGYTSINTGIISNGKEEKNEPIVIYPNPARSYVKIIFSHFLNPSDKLIIYNVLGSIVQTLSGLNNNEVVINTLFLPAGIHYIKLVSNNETEVGKLVIQ